MQKTQFSKKRKHAFVRAECIIAKIRSMYWIITDLSIRKEISMNLQRLKTWQKKKQMIIKNIAQPN